MLEKRGVPIRPYDILIAASAKANNFTLVTHSQKELKRVEGLKIEDWYYNFLDHNPVVLICALHAPH